MAGTISKFIMTGEPLSPCEAKPCGKDASCVSLNTDFFCLCGEGYYYNYSSSSCMKGKTFPGEIEVAVNETAGLEDKSSKNYEDLYNTVVPFFKKAFNKTDFDYGQTIILRVSTVPSQSARSAMRDVKNVVVSVVNMFGENTTQNEDTISEAVAEAAKQDKTMGKYTAQNLCDYYGCVKNAKDNCQNGLQCTCKPGWERPNELTPFCFSSMCPGPCSAEDKKQCVVRDNGERECACLPGYQKANEKCEACPFGYSGVDCKDQFQLILTIVGTIAAAIILILLIAFIVSVRSKKKNRNVEEQKLIEDDTHSVRMQQTGFSNFGADNSIFPKVRTGIPSQTANPYANQRSMPRPDY
ncbi:mucin-13 [Acomys russatus]|uniref:mucin-13 n=1 Tax=Acomys russatus TaxID=60746 RepID=UPI0021E21B48|nr:mucin-13 [Acomys russatus]